MEDNVKRRNTNISVPKASKVQVQYSIYVLTQTMHTIPHTCWCTVIMQGHIEWDHLLTEIRAWKIHSST